ncbi:PH domain-containing protein [Agromyces tardus]|uniref:PH domain-containing protein n=1 Tax=Agromyces tardus TaxID=2583849 RepID=A0A3M8A9X4_9MICO|nr:PH domain-containing protein [Agromyces tardus]RNB47902.1 PH domain-containing protein [Agromyces tardus]
MPDPLAHEHDVEGDGAPSVPAREPIAAPPVPDVAGEVRAEGPAGAAVTAAPARTAPDDTGWRRVSPKYVVVEVVGSLIGTAVLVGGLLIVNALFDLTWAVWIAVAVGIAALIGIAFEPRRVRSIGYRLRADDLVFRRGIMFQRQVAVPYGRMQLVDITRGPVARALGLADLRFVTAAAATAVTLPGLPLEDAESLRDELVALAETRRAGL